MNLTRLISPHSKHPQQICQLWGNESLDKGTWKLVPNTATASNLEYYTEQQTASPEMKQYYKWGIQCLLSNPSFDVIARVVSWIIYNFASLPDFCTSTWLPLILETQPCFLAIVISQNPVNRLMMGSVCSWQAPESWLIRNLTACQTTSHSSLGFVASNTEGSSCHQVHEVVWSTT